MKSTKQVTNGTSSGVLINFKTGKSIKEIIPPIFSEPRKMNMLFNDENFNLRRKKENNESFKPFELFPEWPSQEEVEKFNIDQQKIYLEKFFDPIHEEIFLPASLFTDGSNTVYWKRPSEYILDYYLTKEIVSRFPLKNVIKFKKFIYEMYNHDICPLENKKKKKHESIKIEHKNEYSSENKRILKTFFKVFDKNDFYIVKYVEKEDENISDDESDKVTNKINKNQKEDFTLNANGNSKIVNKQGAFVPSKIIVEDKTNFFNKWIGSILQFIHEFGIYDDEDDPIWKKIYPQINGIPYYNPNGRYWIKLHHMGKLRKVEVDDRIPCDKEFQSLFPKCHQIEEIWPAILTKAILKLFSYKFKFYTKSNSIIGDVQIIHALTGYFGEVVELNNMNTDVKNFLKKIEISSDENLNVNENNKEKSFILFYNQAIFNFNENENSPKIEPSPQLQIKKPGTFTNKLLPSVTVDILKPSPIIFETAEILLKEFSIKRSINNKMVEVMRQKEIRNKLSMDDTPSFKKKKLSDENIMEYMVQENKENFDKFVEEDLFKKDKRGSYVLPDFEEFGNSLKKEKVGFLEKLKMKYRANREEYIDNSPMKIENQVITDHDFKSLNENVKETIFNGENPNKFVDRLGTITQEKELVQKFNTIGNQNILQLNKLQSISIPSNNSTSRESGVNTLTSTENLRNSLKSKKTFGTSTFNRTIDSIRKMSMVNGPAKTKSCIFNSKAFKKENNIYYGFVYPIIEVFETKEFNKKRLMSIDLNDLKLTLNEMKNSYKKLTKEEKKNYLTMIMDLGTKYREIKDNRVMEMKNKGKNTYLFKIANNCHNSPQLNIYCEFNDEEIDVVLKCILNNWEFPPFEYYEKLASSSSKGEKKKYNVLFKTDLPSDLNNMKLELSQIKEVDSPQKEYKREIVFKDDQKIRENEISMSPNVNRNNMKKKTEKKESNSNSKYDPSVFLRNFNNNLQGNNSNLPINPTTPKKHELIGNNHLGIHNNKISPNEFLIRRKNSDSSTATGLLKRRSSLYNQNQLKRGMSFFNVFDDVNHMTTDEYLREIYDELIFGEIEKYSNEKKIKRRKIKGQWISLEEIKKNFEYFVYLFKNNNFKIKNNFDLNIYSAKDNISGFDKNYRVYFICLKEDAVKSEGKENTIDPKAKNTGKTSKNLPNTNVIINVPQDNIVKTKNSEISQKILLEFTTNNGKNDQIQDLEFFIVFDIYEISQSESKNENLNLKYEDMRTTGNFNNGNLKLVYENVQLKGFYSIFYKENFESGKEYLIYIKSTFTPFGYNLKIFTEIGFVEPMSYDKYLIQFGGMKNMKNFNFKFLNIESNSVFVVGKFIMKINSDKSYVNIKQFIEILNKSFIRFKFSINLQDDYLLQYLQLYKQIKRKKSGDLAIKEGFYNLNKMIPINEIFIFDLNEFDLQDEIIFTLILGSPFDIAESLMNIDVTCCSVDYLSFNNLEIVNPYEINDNKKLDKNLLIFKEIFYVPEKVYATLFILVKLNKNYRTINFKKAQELESLKEVDENSIISDAPLISLRSQEFKEENIEGKTSKLRCILKIFEQNEQILNVDFYDYILIPNLVLKGIPVSLDTTSNITKKSKDSVIEVIDYSKILTQYKIQCYLDKENCKLKDEMLDWKIKVFASETIGFVQDTTKEDHERALIQSWESCQPGRSQKSQNSRIKYVEERKTLVDFYMNNLAKDNSMFKSSYDNTDYFMIANSFNETNQKLIEYPKHKKNLSYNGSSLQQGLNLNKSVNSTISIEKGTKFDLFNEKDKNNSNDFYNNNIFKKKNPSPYKTHSFNSNFRNLASTILIDETLMNLNEKLHRASEYYSSKSNFSHDLKQCNSNDGNSKDSRMHVSNYIRKFLNETHESSGQESITSEIFNLKNCKINSKILTESPDNKTNLISTTKKPHDVNQPKKQISPIKKPALFRNITAKNESDHIKNINDKLYIKHNFKKNESERIFEIRNTFMTNFNENISRENKLYEELINNYDHNNLENYIQLYKSLLNEHPAKISSTLIDIQKIISLRKDQLLGLSIEKNEIKNKLQAENIFNDIKTNGWIISEKNISFLFGLINGH